MNEGQWISNAPPVTTTTVITPVETANDYLAEPVFSVNERLSEPLNPPETTSLTLTASHSTATDWTERWFEAEWNDFPFEETIKLLEERYPPNTPNKYHFRLSTAVEFLREGGKLKGLDNVWND